MCHEIFLLHLKAYEILSRMCIKFYMVRGGAKKVTDVLRYSYYSKTYYRYTRRCKMYLAQLYVAITHTVFNGF